MTDAERDDLYARLLIAETERDAALWQLRDQGEEITRLQIRLAEMRKALD